MQNTSPEAGRQDIRARLIALIEASNAELDGQLAEDTSLIKSGMLDSLGLFNVAVFIEKEAGRKVDITTFDLTTEWDTISDILNFIQKQRAGR